MIFKNKTCSKAFSLVELSIVILVIGILIAGVSEGKKLLQRSALNSARALTKSSPVVGIKDLLLWYETSLEESFSSATREDGATITTWYDINPQSVTKINATVYGGTTTFEENIFGGIPGVYFSNNGSLQHNNMSLVGVNFTIFFVEKKQSLASALSKNYIIGGLGSASNESFEFFYDNSGVFNAGLRTKSVSYSDAQVSRYEAVMHSFTFSKTVGMKYWANGGGSADASSSVNTTPFSNPNSYNTRIGNYFYTDNRYLYNGYIAEYIIFTRDLKNEERQSIEKYLSQKYKITITG